MKSSHHQLWIVAAAAVMFLTNLGATGLWDLDEALYSSIAREMGDRGDWVVPYFNGKPFNEKPPLMFWTMMGSFKLLGVSEFSARLGSVVLAIGTALATYHLARRLFSAEVGFWAGLITASNIIFTVSARAATVDSALTFVTVAAMGLFAVAAGVGREGPPAAGRWRKPWLCFPLIGVLLGVAILAKGPIGFLLPAGAMALYMAVQGSRRAPSAVRQIQLSCSQAGTASESRADGTRSVPATFWCAIKRIAATLSPVNVLRANGIAWPLVVTLFAAGVAAPWFVAVAVKTDGEWLRQFVTKYNLRPFNSVFLGHRGPFYYHFVVVLVGLFPWSVFLGPTVTHIYRRLRAGGSDWPSLVFLLCWAGTFFGFWSVCSTKLPHYVLPAYPALAILTAVFLHAWIERAEAAARPIMPIATGILAFVGVAMLAVLPWVAARWVPGEQPIALVGATLVLGGGMCFHYLRQGRRRAYAAVFAAAAVAFITAMFGPALARVDRHQHSRAVMAEIRRDCPAAPQIAAYNYCDASTVYYAGGPVAEFRDAAKLRDFLESSPSAYVVTTGAEFEALEQSVPGAWRVVARRPRFLGKGEIVAASCPNRVSRR